MISDPAGGEPPARGATRQCDPDPRGQPGADGRAFQRWVNRRWPRRAD